MSIFINQSNDNKTGVAPSNSNYTEMGVDVGDLDNSSLCACPAVAPSANSTSSAEQRFLDIPTSAHANNKAMLQEQAATDSGRESVNEFESSLEETQLSKKPCTAHFYASSGDGASSQTTWYLKPEDEATTESLALEEIPVTVLALEGDARECSPSTISNAAVTGERRSWHIERSNENLLLSANTTAALTTTTTSPTNNGISIIGIRAGGYNDDYRRPAAAAFSSNLAHQLRAVSSPSLSKSALQDAAFVTTTTTTASSSSTTAPKHTPPPPTTTTLTTATKTTIHLPTTADAECEVINSSSSLGTSMTQNVGVLEKFKRTFSNFNRNQQPATQQQQQQHQQPSPSSSVTLTPASVPLTSSSTPLSATPAPGGLQCTVNNTAASVEQSQTADQSACKYRFGPLIWRSSKERRKTKYNRRDKCNSGDSGIQIELENDEQFARVIGGSQNTGLVTSGSNVNTASSHRSRIRRTNSAKATHSNGNCGGAGGVGGGGDGDGDVCIMRSTTSSTSGLLSAKAKVLKKMDAYDCRTAPASVPARSLSQPNGLDRLMAPHTRTNAELDESDTDSVSSSHPDCTEATHQRPLHAEVLYNFTSAGPQELSLERGSLVEILRKEIGPWWYGRKKSDAIVETLFEPQLGWFPKDFVRIIHFPETDVFYASVQQQQQQQQRAARSRLSSPSMDETLIAGTDPCTEITIANNSSSSSNNNNVTTIIIEPATETNMPVKRNAATYCQSDQEDAGENVTMSLSISKNANILHDNTNIMRNSAVKELYDTELNYVKLLTAICQGYLPAMSKRLDIFTEESIRMIFSNIESIFKFQQQFLEALRSGIERNSVAQVFLDHQSGFLVYSTYCNSYPRALIELDSYSHNKEARNVMENCRLAENLPELPLSAHLLAPIQRICRYPLHLAELIKNSSAKSGDSAAEQSVPSETLDEVDASLYEVLDTKESLEIALKAMKNVTEAVNEGKRHSENLARHQSNFENFSGPPLHFNSTRYFMQIDATRVSPNLWNNTYTLFLFDHQLIYCKKDILKRQHFIYKGRIFLDTCRILNLPDGKIFGATVKNALRIYCDTRNKWFDFSFRSANRKRRFLTTLALERQFCGKNLFISELAGDETTDDRDLSDREYHSDYETAAAGTGVGGGGGGLSSGSRGSVGEVGSLLHSGESTYSNLSLHCKENIYDVLTVNGSSGGSSSVPESPAKQQMKFCDTLPKKSQRQVASSATTTSLTASNGKDSIYDYSTSSLGRRKLGNWFRKSKSTNSTPNQSPTHQPMVLGAMMQLHSDSSSLSSPALGGGKLKELTSSASS